MDLDFEELPQSGNASNTAKWFQENPDINAGKILDGLLGLKTEFPDESSNPGSTGTASSGEISKPSSIGVLDHTTANLLQMSVPDPSTTFLDIGTELGHSLYEDDPFNLETLLPSNFNVNQLDMLPSSPDGSAHNGHGQHHFQNNNNQHILNAHGAEASMAITAKAIMENNNIGHNLSMHPNNHHGVHNHKGGRYTDITKSYTDTTHQSTFHFPETTISPMSGPPGSGSSGPHRLPLDPMQPMAFNSVIKTEPGAYIKREDNNNAPPNLMQLHPPHIMREHMLNEGYLLHHNTSPMSSMSLPGSPPGGISNHEKNQAAMVMASLSSGGGPRMGPGGHLGLPQSPPNPHGGGHGGSPHTPQPGGQGQHHGGGKMRTPTPSTSRKKSANEPTPEEEELANIPSLQMRIKILQQRVRHLFFMISWQLFKVTILKLGFAKLNVKSYERID